MSNFAILRVQKLKTVKDVNSATAHNKRIQKPKNANQEKEYLNQNSTYKAADRIESQLEKHNVKVRKDAVLALEYMVSFSPEFEDNLSENEIIDWAKENLNYFNEKHGKDNVVEWSLHRDEKTTHMHFICLPLVKKEVRKKFGWKLCASDFVNGKKKLTEMQDDYAQRMARFGLKRGLKGSKSQHQTMKEINSDANKFIATIQNEIEKEFSIIDNEIDREGNFIHKEKVSDLFSEFRKFKEKVMVYLSKISKENKKLRDEKEKISDRLNKLDQLANDLSVRNTQLYEANRLNSDLKYYLESYEGRIDDLEKENKDLKNKIELKDKKSEKLIDKQINPFQDSGKNQIPNERQKNFLNRVKKLTEAEKKEDGFTF